MTSKVQEVIEALQNQASGLQSAVEILEGRLAPILAEPDPPPDKAVEVDPPSGRVRYELAKIFDSVVHTRILVDQIVERLEL